MIKEQSYAIKVIRCIAVILIFSCHILQSQNSSLALWLNTGVQIFFLISGTLFGSKIILNKRQWYKKRFIRILKPYYIYIFFILMILSIFYNKEISFKLVLIYLINMQGILGNILALGHLWYIPLMLFCYIITPYLFKYKAKGELKFFIYLLILVAISELLFKKISMNFAPGIISFAIGFYFSNRYKCNFIKKYYICVLFLTIVLLPINVFLLYNIIKLNNIYGEIANFEFYFYHVFLGCTIFFSLFFIFSNLKAYKNKPIDFIDKYSYEIYLTHHIFILGTLSIIHISKYLLLNIILVILATSTSALILKKVSNVKLNKAILRI
ncbi:acyltransferase [Clostridium felsineum]|uniref:acyltransferase family protein n=1 Tax=Clostridium felsineum TaxID=36839 RepID=UPI00358DACFF|nr:acyltransferase [Clostridium felsineum]